MAGSCRVITLLTMALLALMIVDRSAMENKQTSCLQTPLPSCKAIFGDRDQVLGHSPAVINLAQGFKSDPGQAGHHMLVRNISELGQSADKILERNFLKCISRPHPKWFL